MTVVSNTSPMMNLAVVGEVRLLEQLFGRIVIPDAVSVELSQLSSTRPELGNIGNPASIEIGSVVDRPLMTLLRGELDPGEAEAVALAHQVNADLLLIDEKRGRRIASRLKLKFMGILGVLLLAKRKGHLTAVKPTLDELITKAGFWVGQQLYARVLAEAGE